MEKIITALPTNSDKGNINFRLPLPNMCPVCSVAYASEPQKSFYVVKQANAYQDYTHVYSLYFCPHCDNLFLVCYHVSEGLLNRNPAGCIIGSFPTPSSVSSFSEQLKNLSPKFVEIYHQSEKAENEGLTEICGIGYRKSLEFLIKDFSIFLTPEKTDIIQRESLANCINNFINNKRIQTLAKASAWLGNDETHYVRKHADYNLEHLKIFISSCVAFIDSELSFLEAEKLLSSPKK